MSANPELNKAAGSWEGQCFSIESAVPQSCQLQCGIWHSLRSSQREDIETPCRKEMVQMIDSVDIPSPITIPNSKYQACPCILPRPYHHCTGPNGRKLGKASWERCAMSLRNNTSGLVNLKNTTDQTSYCSDRLKGLPFTPAG